MPRYKTKANRKKVMELPLSDSSLEDFADAHDQSVAAEVPETLKNLSRKTGCLFLRCYLLLHLTLPNP